MAGAGSSTDWPRDIGEHRVTADWECADCGASFDCLSQFRQSDCGGSDAPDR